MCSRAGVLLMALCAAAPPLRAQGPDSADARDRRLLARAESLESALEATRLASDRVKPTPGSKLFTAHGLTFVVDGLAAEADVGAAADTASLLLDELGAVPKDFLAACLFVWSSARDTAKSLAGRALGGKRRVPVMLPSVVRTGNGRVQVVPVAAEAGWPVARAALKAFAATLDGDWRAWLPADYGLQRPLEGGEARPWQMFTPGSSTTGAGCLSGRAASCRSWLGIDRDADPYVTRYRPSELRELFLGVRSPARVSAPFRACAAGSDSACVAIARETGQPSPVPADASSRRSLLRAVHDLYGAPALAAALRDTSGSIGARLARATRASEDSLVLAWRGRVLGLRGAVTSRAGAKEAVPALLFAGILLLAAAGSGRWR